MSSMVLFLLVVIVFIISVIGKPKRKNSTEVEEQQVANISQQSEAGILNRVPNPLSRSEKVVSCILVVLFLYWVSATLMMINVFDYRYRNWTFTSHCYWHSCNYGDMFSTYFFVFVEAIIFSFIGLISMFSSRGSQMRRISIGLSIILAVLSVFIMHSFNHVIIYNLNFSLVVIGGYWLLYWMFELSLMQLLTIRKPFLSRLRLGFLEAFF